MPKRITKLNKAQIISLNLYALKRESRNEIYEKMTIEELTNYLCRKMTD